MSDIKVLVKAREIVMDKASDSVDMPLLYLDIIVKGDNWEEKIDDVFVCPFRMYNFSAGHNGGDVWNPNVFGLGNLYNALTVLPAVPVQGYQSNIEWGNGSESPFMLVIEALIRDCIYEAGSRTGWSLAHKYPGDEEKINVYTKMDVGYYWKGILVDYVRQTTDYIRKVSKGEQKF